MKFALAPFLGQSCISDLLVSKRNKSLERHLENLALGMKPAKAAIHQALSAGDSPRYSSANGEKGRSPESSSFGRPPRNPSSLVPPNLCVVLCTSHTLSYGAESFTCILEKNMEAIVADAIIAKWGSADQWNDGPRHSCVCQAEMHTPCRDAGGGGGHMWFVPLPLLVCCLEYSIQ